MSFMSRFRKGRDSEDEFEQLDGPADEDEQEGLFMMGGAGRAPAPETGRTDLHDEEVEASAPAPLTPETGPAEAPQEEAGAPQGVQTITVGTAEDDPLALFRGTVVESETSELTSDIEDVPVDELLAELRELQALLPPGDGAE